MALKVAINGTGRIGIIVAKIITERDDIELVALNTTSKPEMLEYLLKFDSVHRGIDAKVINENTISIGGKNVRMFRERDADKVDFGSTGAEVVIECTGVFSLLLHNLQYFSIFCTFSLFLCFYSFFFTN